MFLQCSSWHLANTQTTMQEHERSSFFDASVLAALVLFIPHFTALYCSQCNVRPISNSPSFIFLFSIVCLINDSLTLTLTLSTLYLIYAQ